MPFTIEWPSLQSESRLHIVTCGFRSLCNCSDRGEILVSCCNVRGSKGGLQKVFMSFRIQGNNQAPLEYFSPNSNFGQSCSWSYTPVLLFSKGVITKYFGCLTEPAWLESEKSPHAYLSQKWISAIFPGGGARRPRFARYASARAHCTTLLYHSTFGWKR